MDNALDYLDWRGDLDFQVSPVNEVDVFLCAQLVAPDYSGIVSQQPVSIGTVRDRYFETHGDQKQSLGALQSADVLPMLRRLPDTKRFSGIRLSDYVDYVNHSNEEQFSAVTVLFPTGEICVVFRGTDDTIVGWKESFNLAVMESVPAQHDALEYLRHVAAHFPNVPIAVCGHSKGGNLAVYASVMAEEKIRDRIARVYSFDGPGFPESFIASDSCRRMEKKIITVTSNQSIVGVLLNRVGTNIIVPSSVAGPEAHDGFKWEVKGTGFVRLESRSPFSMVFEEAMASTLNSMKEEEKKAFIEELYAVILSTGAETCTEFSRLKPSAVLSLFMKQKQTQRTRTFIITLTDHYLRISHRNNMEDVDRMLKDYHEKHKLRSSGWRLKEKAG